MAAWNETEAAYPAGALVHQLFEAQAARAPARTAVKVSGAELTYAELEASANRIAHALRVRGADSRPAGRPVPRAQRRHARRRARHPQGRRRYVPLDPAFPAGACASWSETPARRARHDRGPGGDAGACAEGGGCSSTPMPAPSPRRPGPRLRRTPRPQARRPRLRHLHLGLDRQAQGRRRPAPRGRQLPRQRWRASPGLPPTTCWSR